MLEKNLDECINSIDTSTGFDIKLKRREYIAKMLEEQAKNIRRMIYRTYKEYKEENPKGKCPNCGKETLDID